MAIEQVTRTQDIMHELKTFVSGLEARGIEQNEENRNRSVKQELKRF